MSGYEALFPVNTVNILDRSLTPTTYFGLNAAPGNNIVVVKLLVSSALGFTDISRVNMTIIDPNSRPAKGATNVTMQPSAPSNPTGPFEFIASWVYSSNSTQGTYQVLIDIIDIQNQIAFAFNGPASFGLVPPGFVPFPYNLIPYFIVGGVGAAGGVGGAVLYRKNRRKNYLIPFEHFNTLTGGELNGGTVITVEGNTGSGKSLLLEQLMSEDLRSGRPCVFVTTADFPNNIRANLKTLGLDISGYEQNGLLTFVDGYSAEAGQESREKISIPSLGDLTTLGIKITSALPSPSFKGGSLYFDSLTPLASKAKSESIVSFVQSVGARVKGLAGKAFFTVGLGIDGSVQRQLEDTADCIVQMEAFEESGSRKRRLRIAKFRAHKHQEGWALFTIEDGKGIIFYSKKPRK
jgi:KaiC/GvpD/RAD55 family RecA-like ATPase